jgi:hypothetical protein
MSLIPNTGNSAAPMSDSPSRKSADAEKAEPRVPRKPCMTEGITWWNPRFPRIPNTVIKISGFVTMPRTTYKGYGVANSLSRFFC